MNGIDSQIGTNFFLWQPQLIKPNANMLLRCSVGWYIHNKLLSGRPPARVDVTRSRPTVIKRVATQREQEGGRCDPLHAATGHTFSKRCRIARLKTRCIVARLRKRLRLRVFLIKSCRNCMRNLRFCGPKTPSPRRSDHALRGYWGFGWHVPQSKECPRWPGSWERRRPRALWQSARTSLHTTLQRGSSAAVLSFT